MPHNFSARGESTGSPHVFLAIPSYGPVPVGTVYSLWNAQIALRAAGIRVDLEIMAGHCHVDDARNDLVRTFLETDAEMLVFIDADIGFDPVDLVKLVKHDRDIVAGVYPLKQDNEDFPVRPIPGEIWADKDGLVEVEAVPTGFLKIKRRVLELLESEADRFPTRKDWPDRRKMAVIFERAIVQGGRWSGDYNFCRKARELGYKIHVDPSFHFEHSGEKFWGGSLGDYWRRVHGVLDAEFKQALIAIRQGSEGPAEYKTFADKWGNAPWSAGEGLLTAWVDLVRETPGPILECGAGISTILAAAANPETQVFALEDNVEWAVKIRTAAEENGLDNLTVILTSIEDGWYVLPENMPRKFSLILVDGPVRGVGNNDRGALVRSGINLSGSIVVWDDVDQDVMREMIKETCALYGAEPHFLEHPTKDFAVARLNEAA